MRLPQFVYLAGPNAEQLANHLSEKTLRVRVNLNDAVVEFRQTFCPHLDLEKVTTTLYAMDKFSIGTAGLRFLKDFTWNDPEVETLIYPVRSPSDVVPFVHDPLYVHAQHLFIRIGSNILVPAIGGVSVLSIPDFTDVKDAMTALEFEFAASMRAVS